jgi:GNAT superfamily N-acetyltransferase
MIERSAGEAFRTMDALSYVADGPVMSVEQHLAFIDAQASWVAVDTTDRPLGFICAEIDAAEAHIVELSVRHDLQGRGYGRTLIEAVVDWARRSDLDAVTLTTFRDLRFNEIFYQRMGFVTLDQDNLSPRLRDILRIEEEHGLPGSLRCAMRLPLLQAA